MTICFRLNLQYKNPCALAQFASAVHVSIWYGGKSMRNSYPSEA